MVYEIRPHADRLNRMVELEYQTSPNSQRSWMDYVLKEEPVAEESAPVLIRSEHQAPLPAAFEISRDFWCVSAPVKDLMQDLFGSQVVFYEVPVTAEKRNAPQPSTNFVTFSHFYEGIDWQKSKVRKLLPSRLRPDTEVFNLADTPDAAVFKAISNDRQMIWIDRNIRKGNRLFMPGFKVYVTDPAAQMIAEAFPGTFILRKKREDPSATT